MLGEHIVVVYGDHNLAQDGSKAAMFPSGSDFLEGGVLVAGHLCQSKVENIDVGGSLLWCT